MPPAKKSEPAPSSSLRRHLVQAIAPGFANNVLYDADAEPFELVIDHSITLPGWVQILDEGEPVSSRPTLNAARVEGAPVPAAKAGFAKGIAAPGGGDVI